MTCIYFVVPEFALFSMYKLKSYQQEPVIVRTLKLGVLIRDDK